MGFKRGFKAEANRISIKIRQKIGISDIDPIEPAEICEIFDIELLSLSEMAPVGAHFLGIGQKLFSAVTVPNGIRRAIVHNDAHHPYRQRSNICHELAHCFLGHECTPPLTEKGERIRDGGVEAEANFLAGALLLPNEAAVYVVNNGLIAVAQTRYGVSQSMLDYRLRVSGAFKRYQRRIAS